VGTQARCEALTEILVEAEKLKMYRSDGTAYCEKCDNLVVRIQGVFTDVKIEDLSADEIEIIKAIKEKIILSNTNAIIIKSVWASPSQVAQNPWSFI
jgi:dTDP-4-amino-4,6-dideoxygalactose transaminase